ncbi:O-methylsterigmatocystin oxidoreductase [Fonsecaea pedrosoi]|nr:O-methylsterigmatocystin oxidoreductase [Fonsecaea pedrosoi]
MAQFSTTQLFISVAGVLVVALLVYRLFFSKSQFKGGHSLPPGPTPRFLVGNLPDLPPAGAKEWLHWLKHKELYGPISSLTVLGQTMIIISDQKVAVDLMEKRSASHSSRPKPVFGADMCGWNRILGLMPYSNKSRAYRRALHTVLGTSSAIDPFRPLIELETRRFLLSVLENPQEVLHLIRTQAGSIILKISYGYSIEPKGRDPLVDLAERSLDHFSKACTPGAWLVDVIPVLKYLPDWLPGTEFKRTAREWKATLDTVSELPYKYVQQKLRGGVAEPSYLSKLLQTEDGSPLSPEAADVAQWSSFSLYAGGADTTVSSMACFVLAMTLNPEVQRKAQAEIDAVVGSSRLPTFSDRESLPYVNALVKEVLRWHPVGPMGVPHLTTKADVYEDYFIPEGSVLIPNIWAMLHDETVYPDPDKFDPSRFLVPNPPPEPRNIAFGFGRRICPGKLFAEATLFSSISAFLAVFNVRKCVENGKEVDPVVDFDTGIISHPKPFKCDIVPRSAIHEKLIRSVEIEHPTPEHGDARYLAHNVTV